MVRRGAETSWPVRWIFQLELVDETSEVALKGIRQVVADVVADLASDSEKVPEPLATKKYSGK